MKKETLSRTIPEQPFHHKSTTCTLPIRKKILSVTNLISSPSLLPIPVASPYKYFHHRYLLVSFRLSFPVYSRYLPPRFETYLFVSILESKPNGDFLFFCETPNSLTTNLTRPNRTDPELGTVRTYYLK